jgi:competence protein ComEA
MASQGDRRATIALLALAVAGLLVRFWQAPGVAPGAVVYRQASGELRPARDSIAARAARLLRPIKQGEHIDLDRAAADELVRLPHVGPGLAARIVGYREAHGPFGSLDALDHVPGIGPAVLEAIRPHAEFSAAGWVQQGQGTGVRDGVPLMWDPTEAQAVSPNRRRWLEGVHLNTATEAELERLPGIGPVLAHAIVADREARGPFKNAADVTRVRGIGAATLRRLEGRIVVP